MAFHLSRPAPSGNFRDSALKNRAAFSCSFPALLTYWLTVMKVKRLR